MLVFLDESGDPGLKIVQGSSRYFVISLVVFQDEEETKAIEQRLQLLRRELHLNPHFEFKFNKCSRELRIAFLNAAAPYDFFYYGIVIDKAGLYGEGFKVKESFYKYATQLVFLNAREHLEKAFVHIDASGNRDFRRQITSYLKRKINHEKQHISRITFLNSANSNLIQLADMVAGAINRSHGDKPDAGDYVRVIMHRKAHVQVWPNLGKDET